MKIPEKIKFGFVSGARPKLIFQANSLKKNYELYYAHMRSLVIRQSLSNT